jgi:hypothetical protein
MSRRTYSADTRARLRAAGSRGRAIQAARSRAVASSYATMTAFPCAAPPSWSAEFLAASQYRSLRDGTLPREEIAAWCAALAARENGR